jgi:hypothetical protein
MKPFGISSFFGLGAGVMLLGAGAISVQGADYAGSGGELPMRGAPGRTPVAAVDALAGRPATFFPELDYHLVLGLVGSGLCLEFSMANGGTVFLVQPARSTVPHFRSARQSVNYFNWGQAKPAFALSGNHFHSPAKLLPSVEVANHAKPGASQFPEVPTLNQKAPGPNHIVDDPKNAGEHP